MLSAVWLSRSVAIEWHSKSEDSRRLIESEIVGEKRASQDSFSSPLLY